MSRGAGGERDNRGKRGRPRNVNRGLRGKDSGGGIGSGSRGGAGVSNGEKEGTTVTEQQ